VFPNEKCELLAGCTEERRAGRRAAQKGSAVGCEKGRDGLQKRVDLWTAFSAAQFDVQPASPP